jgi:antitoxin PrlF
MATVETEAPAEKLLAKSKISSKGQITLPVEIRDRLGVKAGESVKFVVVDGWTVVLPVREDGNPFDKWIGAAPLDGYYKDTAEWMSDIRDDEERKADLAEWHEIKQHKARQAP